MDLKAAKLASKFLYTLKVEKPLLFAKLNKLCLICLRTPSNTLLSLLADQGVCYTEFLERKSSKISNSEEWLVNEDYETGSGVHLKKLRKGVWVLQISRFDSEVYDELETILDQLENELRG